MLNSYNINQAITIAKENLIGLKFPQDEVLESKDEIKIRYYNLERSMILGNIEHDKIKIIFEDDKGLKLVETTIWAVTDKQVIFKQGNVIPINRIYEVR